MKKFTGMLSRHGQVVADPVSGHIEEQKTGSTIQWAGSFRAPIRSRTELETVATMRLDLDNGFSINIDLKSYNFRSDNEWLAAESVSNGRPLAGRFS